MIILPCSGVMGLLTLLWKQMERCPLPLTLLWPPLGIFPFPSIHDCQCPEGLLPRVSLCMALLMLWSHWSALVSWACPCFLLFLVYVCPLTPRNRTILCDFLTELICILFILFFQSEFTSNISFNSCNCSVKTFGSIVLFSFYKWRKWKPTLFKGPTVPPLVNGRLMSSRNYNEELQKSFMMLHWLL